jgi:hypothetical protein
MGLRGALEEFVDQSLIGLGLLGGEAAKLGEETRAMKTSEERFHRHKKRERWRRVLSAQADPSTPLRSGSFTGVKGKPEKSLRAKAPELQSEVEGRDGR